MPVLNEPRSPRAKVVSPSLNGPWHAATSACVPDSASATTRTWGKAPCPSPRPEPGRPKCASFSGVPARSKHVPSMLMSRQPRSNAPLVSSKAIGFATAANIAPRGFGPRRARALNSEALAGTFQCRDHPEAQDRPSTS